MNNLNTVMIDGNLTRDPVMALTPKGTPVCTFSVASNRWYRVDEETQKEVSYFDVEAWTKLAERCGEQLHKGRGVRVAGRIKQDRWSDKDGNPRSKVKIVADHVEFRAPRPQNDETGDESDQDETVAESSDEKEPALTY